MMVFLTFLYLLLTPAALMLLAKRWIWIDRVSPMSLLYIIGLLVANFTPFMQVEGRTALVTTAGSVCIPIAIPLMLMSCNLATWNTRKALKAFFSGLMAVLVMSLAGFFLFRANDTPEHFAQVTAVSIGIYTGGIPNMGAIAQGVGMDNDTYLYLTSYDLIVTGLYLIFVIFFGKIVFRKLLPNNIVPNSKFQVPNSPGSIPPINSINSIPPTNSDPPATSKKYKLQISNFNSEIVIRFLLALAMAAVSFLLSKFFPESLQTPMLILILTTLSIIAALIISRIQSSTSNSKLSTTLDSQHSTFNSFDLGLYFVYVFCFSIANGCNVRTMDLAGSLNILWFITFVIFGSLVLQVLFAKLLHLDGDSVLVTSVALINSPPFVPLVAALLNNRDVIVLGITVGLLGYMLGNYLGIGIFFLLTL